MRVVCEHPKSVMLAWIEFILRMYICRNEYRKPNDLGANRKPFSSIFLDERGDYFVTFSRKHVISLHLLVSTEYWTPCPKKTCEHAKSTIPAPIKFKFSLHLCRHEYKMSIHLGEIRSFFSSILREKAGFSCV